MDPTITALRTQKSNTNRVNVFLDGEFAFGLSKFVAAWLRVGQELDQSKIEALIREDEVEKAYQRALRLLGYRLRSESEITQNLRKNKFDEQIIQDVISKLTAKDLINDHRFAKTWVENRIEFRPRGRLALQMELRKKSISDEIVEDVLADFDEAPLAYRVAAQRAAKVKPLEWATFYKKITSFLARKGFSYETIRPTVSRVWEEVMETNQVE